jgi:hypothetical protein
LVRDDFALAVPDGLFAVDSDGAVRGRVDAGVFEAGGVCPGRYNCRSMILASSGDDLDDKSIAHPLEEAIRRKTCVQRTSVESGGAERAPIHSNPGNEDSSLAIFSFGKK